MGTKLKQTEQHLIADALRIERANARRDTAKQKTRGEVRGGGAKPWRQKGTGRARQGSIRSVQWKGGGRAFNTAIENHHRKVNKKVKRRALASLLEWKMANERVVVDALAFDKPSTKQFAAFLKDKNIEGKVLFLYNSDSGITNAMKSARNIAKVQILHADAINLQALLNCEWLITTPAIAEKLNLTNG